MNPTLAGFAAIAMWSMLAWLTTLTGQVPPFLLLALSFAIGTLVGLGVMALKPPSAAEFMLPKAVWLVGIGGLFGFHFFYYTALRHAPAAEASLISYLWPLLIVLFASLLPGERLRWFHLAGAILGFLGAALLIIGRMETGLTIEGGWLGYGSALACALIWSAYSVISRLFQETSTNAVTVYCLATAVLAALCHLVFETTIWPANSSQWLAVLGLGLLPVGLAFYAWDYAMKRGPIQLIGSAAYFAPLLSTALLMVAGQARADWRLAAAALLITAGAVLASGRLASQRSGP